MIDPIMHYTTRPFSKTARPRVYNTALYRETRNERSSAVGSWGLYICSTGAVYRAYVRIRIRRLD